MTTTITSSSSSSSSLSATKSKSFVTFHSLNLPPYLTSTLSSLHIHKPTPIQQYAIPRIQERKYNILAQAKTGSGKTAAFALPIIQHLSEDVYGIFACILTPTRELAYQIYEQVVALSVRIDINVCSIVGGENLLEQQSILAKRPHIVVATPGRLASHIRSSTVTPTHYWKYLQYLVYDEADRLTEDTFKDDIQTILQVLPPINQRYTLLFSATMNINDEQLIQMGVTESQCNHHNHHETNVNTSNSKHQENDTLSRELLRITTDNDFVSPQLTVSQLDQRYMFIPQNMKECYLTSLLINEYENKSILIFVSTCIGCEYLSQYLRELSINNVSLHSYKSQDQRRHSLSQFRNGASKILVCTDVASRGLDIPEVQLVLNYDVPRVLEDYVHRAGRTARAGRAGRAITFVSQYDITLFQSIEAYIHVRMESYDVSEKRVIDILQQVNKAKHLAKIHINDQDSKQRMVPEKRKLKELQEQKNQMLFKRHKRKATQTKHEKNNKVETIHDVKAKR